MLSETDSKIIDCTSFIYKITIDKYFYYGQSQRFQQRLKDHLCALKNKSHCNEFMQNVYNKHGDFKMQIVEILGAGFLQKDLNDTEQKYIDKYYDEEECLNLARIAGKPPDPSKPCIITIDGISKEYESMSIAGEILGKTHKQLSEFIAGEIHWPTGWSGNFKGEPPNICTRGIQGIHSKKSKPFVLNGILYTCSQTEAIEKSGFPCKQQALSAALNGHKNWPTGWYGHFEGEEPKECPKPKRNKK
jgi:hypothetical protein